MEVNVVWQFFRAASAGNQLLLFPENEHQPVAFQFPRQLQGKGLCLADYVLPLNDGPIDNVCLFAVTAGRGIVKAASHYKQQGDYLRSHALQALALETAEAAAEWLHARIRAWWGFPDAADMTMRDRFQARYRGRRYSFGYPACPDLSLQRELFRLLQPSDIGITLTDADMMEPEASVSALVMHNPECEYFSAP